MTEKSDSLESQLDALAEKCQADATAAPTSNDAEPSAEASDDLVGSDFADQVQKMLDEAAASIDSDSADEPTESQAAGESDAGADEGSDDQLIAQIDTMLADAANEAIVGDFESVEDQEEAVDDELPADPAAFVASDDPADDTDADEMPSVEGDFHAVDDLEVEAVAEPDDVTDGEHAAELSEAAAAVAAELDADEALTGDFELPGDAMDDDDEPVIETVAAKSPVSPPAAQPAAQQMQMPDDEDAAPAEEPARPSRLIAILAKINQPIAGCSEMTKNILGTLALQTLAVAFVCFLIAGLGRMLGLIVGMPIVMLVTLAAVYVLFIKNGGGNGNNEPTGA